MPEHRFKIGQALHFTGTRPGTPNAPAACKIVRLMPTESGSPVYRIKCTAETFERVARETDLS